MVGALGGMDVSAGQSLMFISPGIKNDFCVLFSASYSVMCEWWWMPLWLSAPLLQVAAVVEIEQ